MCLQSRALHSQQATKSVLEECECTAAMALVAINNAINLAMLCRTSEELMLYLGCKLGYWRGDIKGLVDDIGTINTLPPDITVHTTFPPPSCHELFMLASLLSNLALMLGSFCLLPMLSPAVHAPTTVAVIKV